MRFIIQELNEPTRIRPPVVTSKPSHDFVHPINVQVFFNHLDSEALK